MSTALQHKRLRRIGLLTSGGDCAGLNAALRAVVLAGARQGLEVWGIAKGTAGLLTRPVEAERLDPLRFDGTLLRQGGTVLGTTNHGNPFDYPMPDGSRRDRSDEVIAGWRGLGLDALVGIGGDGSLKILRRLAQQGGIPLVAIPKTIDNDVDGTEIAIGHASALEVATLALDHLQPTAASHDRIMVLETMGRDAGHIALSAGIAGGADVILLPEVRYDLATVAHHLERLKAGGRGFALVVVAEAADQGLAGPGLPSDSGEGSVGQRVARILTRLTGWESRVTILGHLQRGGSPGARDRLMAQIFGVEAVRLLMAGQFDRMVAWSGRGVISVPLAEAVSHSTMVDPDGPLVRTARALGVCLGDGQVA